MIIFNKEQCIGCGKCINDCAIYCIGMYEGKAQLKDDTLKCIHCGHCVSVCPVGAVSIAEQGYDMSDCEPVCPDAPQLNTDAILHALKFRRSIRQYKKQKIEKEILGKFIEAARYSATGANSQRFHFVIVQDRMEEFKEKAWEIFSSQIKQFVEDAPENKDKVIERGIIRRAKLPKDNPLQDTLFWGAPCLIVVAADHGGVWDAGLASQSIEMTALANNIGTLYSGYLVSLINESNELRKWLEIPDCQAKTCILLGYPDVEYYRSAPRKPASVIWK